MERRKINISVSDGKNNESSIYEIKSFASFEKESKFKLNKNFFKTALISAGTAILVTAALLTPKIISYVESANVINNYADNYAINYIETDDIGTSENDIPYGNLTDDELEAFNNGVAAQISDVGDILDTVYPVAKGDKENPNFYLKHDINGDYNENGNIYIDSRNHEGLSDDITYVYGHNLINDKMFGKMANYADHEYWNGTVLGQNLYDEQKQLYGDDANSFIWTDMYGQYRLDICAAGEYNGYDMINLPINFNDKESKQMAIDYINAGSDISADVNLDLNSKIVILQTCKNIDSSTYDDSSPNREYVICKATQLVKFNDFNDNLENGKSRS